jgi:hypothetical protein
MSFHKAPAPPPPPPAPPPPPPPAPPPPPPRAAPVAPPQITPRKEKKGPQLEKGATDLTIKRKRVPGVKGGALPQGGAPKVGINLPTI